MGPAGVEHALEARPVDELERDLLAGEQAQRGVPAALDCMKVVVETLKDIEEGR